MDVQPVKFPVNERSADHQVWLQKEGRIRLPSKSAEIALNSLSAAGGFVSLFSIWFVLIRANCLLCYVFDSGEQNGRNRLGLG
jgi:hypothetical protein